MIYQMVLGDKFIFIRTNSSKDDLKQQMYSFFREYETLTNKDLEVYLQHNGLDVQLLETTDFNIIKAYELNTIQVLRI